MNFGELARSDVSDEFDAHEMVPDLLVSRFVSGVRRRPRQSLKAARRTGQDDDTRRSIVNNFYRLFLHDGQNEAVAQSRRTQGP
jgi:hypothetical protein